MLGDGEESRSASRQVDGGMVYAATIQTPDGVGLFAGTLGEIQDLIVSAIMQHRDVSVQVVEYASYS